jgi:probable phosphoglycerate mutase
VRLLGHRPALGDLPIVEDGGFGEHDPGPDCDGMAFDDYVERYGVGWWEGDPFGTSFPGGETIAAFQFRVGQAIRRTTDAYADQTVVIACHGGVIDAALRGPQVARHGSFEIARSIRDHRDSPGGDNLWCLIRYNDTAISSAYRFQTTPVPPT